MSRRDLACAVADPWPSPDFLFRFIASFNTATTEYTPTLRPPQALPLHGPPPRQPGVSPAIVLEPQPSQILQAPLQQQAYSVLPPRLQAQQQAAAAAAAAAGQEDGTGTPQQQYDASIPNGGLDPKLLPPATAPASETNFDANAAPILPDGRSVYDIDLDALERKDWRLPGSDISDWFNYGFDEITWRAYTERRREMAQMVESLGLVRSCPPSSCPSPFPS